MQDFRNLIVWKKSHDLVLKIYRITRDFPPCEKYGLRSQLRRSVTSIPSNIAEGCGRASSSDFARFLQIAIGSASETQYQILLAKDLKYLETRKWQDADADVSEIRRMLVGLISSLDR